MTMMTLEEVAAAGRVSVRTVMRESKRGNLPVVKLGKSTRIRATDLAAWLNGYRADVAA
jgi:excisionase family DNA binding protein